MSLDDIGRRIVDDLANEVESVVVLNRDEEFEYVSSGFEELSGYTAVELIGSKVTPLLPPEHRATHGDRLRGFIDRGETIRPIGDEGMELQLLRKDGTLVNTWQHITYMKNYSTGAYFGLGILHTKSDDRQPYINHVVVLKLNLLRVQRALDLNREAIAAGGAGGDGGAIMNKLSALESKVANLAAVKTPTTEGSASGNSLQPTPRNAFPNIGTNFITNAGVQEEFNLDTGQIVELSLSTSRPIKDYTLTFQIHSEGEVREIVLDDNMTWGAVVPLDPPLSAVRGNPVRYTVQGSLGTHLGVDLSYYTRISVS